MDCWICGAEATSGEHMTKASDLRMLFGRGRLYLHNDTARNQLVQGTNSKKLMHGALLCEQCNNKRTQPHDRAWETLSAYLADRRPAVRGGDLIRLSDVFPGATHSSMLGVHLFFAKQFGCLIEENRIPLDIRAFSAAILSNTAHPNLFLSFHAVRDVRMHRIAGHSKVDVLDVLGKPIWANWFYDLGPISVRVIWATPLARNKALMQAWHPSRPSKLLRIFPLH